eukprot:4029212-Ditylum_brightwellii.AAC.1
MADCWLMGKSGHSCIHARSSIPQMTSLARKRYCRARIADCWLMGKSGHYGAHLKSPVNKGHHLQGRDIAEQGWQIVG